MGALEPAGAQPLHDPEAPHRVPFHVAFAQLGEPRYRRLVGLWALSLLVIVPGGSLTRILDWTGIPLSVGGAGIYLTLYLPMIACVPMVLWLGYWWGAIPAYLSTLVVGLLGGMPLAWALLFAMANPLGLASLHLAYRAYPMRPDLRSISALLYYFVMITVSSLIGSIGSFVWAYTNQVGMHQFYPVWQGWWLGGVVQGVAVCAPILFLLTPRIECWKLSLGVETVDDNTWDHGSTILPGVMVIATIFMYVIVVRRFTYSALESVLAASPEAQALRPALLNVLEGLALPQWVLLTLVAVTLLFGLRIGLSWATQYRELASELERANRRLRETALTDALTGTYNRGHLLEVLPREVSRAQRHHRPLACLVVDLDHFKDVNDRLGHLAGDEVLVRVAAVLRERVRNEDFVVRFGGEEFVLLLPDSNTGGALIVAEDIRRSIAGERFRFGSEELRVTTSIGVAELADVRGEDAGRELIDLADAALYMAKEQGRNRTIAARLRPADTAGDASVAAAR